MRRLAVVTYSLAGALAASLALLPSPAHAECSEWDIPARMVIHQSNNAQVWMEMTPAEGGFVGKARAHQKIWTEAGGGAADGPLEGTLKGSILQFTVHWHFRRDLMNSTGVYTGTVGPQGRVTGVGYDAEHPETKATWWAENLLQCRTTATPASPPVDSPPVRPPVALGRVQPLPGWFRRADIASTPWGFDDLNTVGWAQAGRAALALCASKGAGAGQFSGHQNTGLVAVQCAKDDAVVRDASAQEISATPWGFTDVNQVSWAQANRAAERLCAGANQGFAGGHFNGHQLNGNYGLVCYRGSSQWFDASDGELAATGWGFATPKLDDVQWSQAMRAATGFCQGKGFEGGFMNGHQAPNRYGVVCQKGLGY